MLWSKYIIHNWVCLMSQSWENVANMCELFTVSSHTQRNLNSIISLSCMSTVSTVRMQQHDRTLNQLLCRPHSSMQINSSCLNSPLHAMTVKGDVLALLKHRIYHQTISALLEAWWHVACWKCGAWSAWRFAPFVQECISMATLVCTHGTVNSDQSWAFWTCSRAYLLCPPG